MKPQKQKGQKWYRAFGLLAVSLLLASQISTTALAAGFTQDASGIRYLNDEGAYAADAWVLVNNQIYRMDANGYLQTGWVQVGGLWYFMDTNGVCTNPDGQAEAPADIAVSAGTTVSPNPGLPAAAVAPASSVSASAGAAFAAAGWVPFSCTDAALLQAGIAAGLVGSDGVSYWAAPAYAEQAEALLRAQTQQTAAGTAPLPPAAAQSAASAADTQTTPAQASATAGSIAQPAKSTVSAPADTTPKTQTVWLSATGSKYHSRNNCGNMNPSRARRISLQDARAQGYAACKKCF